MSMHPTINFIPRLWRPEFADSLDGTPIATDVGQLGWVSSSEFAYDRLPANPWVSIWLRPEFVGATLFFYVGISKSFISFIREASGLDPKGQKLRNFIAIHNLALAIFSFVTAWNSWGIVLQYYLKHGMYEGFCDPNGSLWNEGLGAWSFIFYISKYYEFVDTWILVLKDKKASFLQVYHHTGIALCMWAAVCSQSQWLQFVVLFNSVIHTIMYTYFFAKTLYPQMEIKAARHLTRAQIGQFFLGITLSSGVWFLDDICASPSSRLALGGLQLYGVGLIALFMAFAKRKYKKP